jgi:hypothetical protein
MWAGNGATSRRNFTRRAALLNRTGGAPRFLVRVMLTLLQDLAFLVLVAISLGGFAAAVTWVFAVWFGEKG